MIMRIPMKPQPPDWCTSFGFSCFTPPGHCCGRGIYRDEGPAEKFFKAPLGLNGTKVWVPETWGIIGPGLVEHCTQIDWFTWRDSVFDRRASIEHPDSNREDGYGWAIYRADGDFPWDTKAYCNNWRTAATMPQWAARTWLQVESVRVERVQAITEADALAEGVDPRGPVGYIPASQRMGAARYQYANLWDLIHGPGAWAANPWVFVYTFKPVSAEPGRGEGGEG
jgi:hypothetical protein